MVRNGNDNYGQILIDMLDRLHLADEGAALRWHLKGVEDIIMTALLLLSIIGRSIGILIYLTNIRRSDLRKILRNAFIVVWVVVGLYGVQDNMGI